MGIIKMGKYQPRIPARVVLVARAGGDDVVLESKFRRSVEIDVNRRPAEGRSVAPGPASVGPGT
jgi:hypothetical protein